ncbi:MAG: ABC transporter permease subunit, partial [Bacteroidota bacterium]
MLLVLLVLAVVAAAILSPLYLSFDQIAYSLQQSITIVGLLALGFMLVMVLGEIDISLPATMAIGNVLFAELSQAGVPLYLALPTVILACTTLGTINGLLVVSYNLPSMAVTLGTMGAYRAIALLIGGVGGYASGAFQGSYLWLGSTYLFGTLPVSLILLLVLVAVLALVMHKTVFGRLLYAVGNNRIATRFSGHNVPGIIVSAYAAAGAMAGLAALVFVGQFESARSDNASSILLFIVACVVLGGFEASGGKGKVIGLLLSLLFVGTLQNGMGLANIPGPVQTTIIGCILIGAVWAPALWSKIGDLIRRRRNKAASTLQAAEHPLEGASPGTDATAAAEDGAPRLSLREIGKNFGGIRALHNVSFDVAPGSIHAICGENGAGKSTLVKIITGLHPADTGQVLLDGAPVRYRSPMEARKAGVLAVYQDPKLFPNLSVAENV